MSPLLPGAPLVVGLTGPNAAGKGEAAHFLESLGFIYYSLSDVVREEATARGLDHSRESLIRTGNDLRARFGPGVLAARIAARLGAGPAREGEASAGGAAKPSGEGAGAGTAVGSSVHPAASALGLRAIVDSIRSPGEVAVLRTVPGFVLLGVDAPIAVRFERSRLRARFGDGATLEEFARKESLENTTDPAAQQLTATFKLADVVVDNSGTLEQLHTRVASALRLG